MISEHWNKVSMKKRREEKKEKSDCRREVLCGFNGWGPGSCAQLLPEERC